MDGAAILTGVAMAVGALGWLLRLEGQVKAQAQRHEDHVASNDERHEQHQKRHDEMRGDIAYIRSRIDSALSKNQ